jgi:hypothetical protein
LPQANAAGRWYLKDDETPRNGLKIEIKGIGIGEISDE